MSQADISRIAKAALGERGTISFPVLPQLMPALSISCLDLGASPGIPVAAAPFISAVAAQRSYAVFSCPTGYVLRIDFVKSASQDARVHFGPSSPFSPTLSYVVVDGRLADSAGTPGRVRGYGQSNAAVGALTADGVAVTPLDADQMLLGPWWVTNATGLLLYTSADNVAGDFGMRGVLFEAA